MFAITKKIILGSVFIIFGLLVASCQSKNERPCDIDHLEGGYELIFCDDFSAKTLNTDIWRAANQTRHGSSVLFYSNRKENVYLSDGKLILKSLPTPQFEASLFDFMPYTSARLETKNKLDFTYGRIIVSAKVAPGAGTWPAIWMLPTQNVYGNWPHSGEIDIMEYYGKRPNLVSTAYHTSKYNHTNTNISTIAKTTRVNDVETTFNTFELIWTSTHLEWYINNNRVQTYTYRNRFEASNPLAHVAWPFDQAFHLIINLGMGDAGGSGAGEIDPNILPTTFEIDYVKIYQINYDKFDTESPTLIGDIERAVSNPYYFLWDRAEDDYGVMHYEIYLDDEFVMTSTVNSFRFAEGSFDDVFRVSVRAVDFTNKKSNWIHYEIET